MAETRRAPHKSPPRASAPASTTTRGRTPAATTTTPAPARAARTGVVAAPARTAPVTAAPLGDGLPIGMTTAPLAADVSGQLQTVAPTFGQVLGSVGQGVADSQAALDQGVIDTVKDLADTKITVVTDVIQHLTDDGEPDPSQTQLVSTDLSVLNFFTPTIHEWKRVALSMDLSVGAFSETDGLTFNAEQQGGGVGGVGLFWGFVGLGYDYNYDDTQSFQQTHQQESSWSAGEVRIDAILGPRQTGKFPIPSQVSVGPQIVFSQGAVKETPVTGGGVNRSIDVLISVLKAAGDPNPNKALTVDAGPLRTSFSSTAPFTGSTTNADGNVEVTIIRNVPNSGTGAAKVPVLVRLGELSQTFTLTI
jgi:hypothetical protein